MAQILNITFRLELPVSDWEAMAAQLAPGLSLTPGLRWKLWLLDEPRSQVAGIYLFDDAAMLEAYLDSDLVIELRDAPWVRDVRVSRYDVMAIPSSITRGPAFPLERPTAWC
jgi:hypothetical protein